MAEPAEQVVEEIRVKALREAASWLAAFDQDLPDLDRHTCRRLAQGMRAMAESAARRVHERPPPPPPYEPSSLL